MRSFGYDVATTPATAVEMVAGRAEASYVAGGTNLVDLMRLGVAQPRHLVDVRRVLSDAIKPSGAGGLLIGAGMRNSDLAADPAIRADYPALSQALLAGASGQLRNAATVGGNLLQRTRCLYFQDTSKPCNKRYPGSGCPARTGIHRDLAILGASQSCIATHPSDMAVALSALSATVQVTGPDSERSLALDDLYRFPGDDPSRDTTLAHEELITGVQLPPPDALSRRSAYTKVRDRASYAFAVGAVAAALDLHEGTVRDVRIAWGAVAHRPWRARAAEDALRGGRASVETFTAAVAGELEAAQPLPDNAFKVALTTNITVALLATLAGLDRGAA